MDSKNDTLLRFIATIFFLAMVTVNALANTLPINGLDTGDVSDLYPNLFTPAGFTFSIWSVIYTLLAAFIVHCWMNRSDANLTSLLVSFIVSCVFNISWILVWHHLLPFVSVVVMILLLITLTVLFLKTRGLEVNAFMVKLPFALYLSWICVATIANITAWFVSMGWNTALSPETTWAVIMIVIAAALGTFFALRFKTAAFPVVTSWALFGIMSSAKEGQNSEVQLTALALSVGMLALTIFVAVRFKRV